MFGFSELEERLLGDNGSEVLIATLASVRAIGAEVQGALDAGLPSHDFDAAQSILTAVKAAEHILSAPIPVNGAQQ